MVEKRTRKPRTPATPDTKIIETLKETNKLLTDIKDILDGIWRRRTPPA